MVKYLRLVDSFYLLLLGVGIGGIIACGAFAAPVVFGIHDFMPMITQSDSGIIMGKIFMRLNAYLVFLMIIIGLYEGFGFLSNVKKINLVYTKFWLLLGVCSIILIALFAFYYTPFILDSKNLFSENFDAMHKQSVWVFKALMFCLSVLFIWRIYMLHYAQQNKKNV